MTLPRLIPAALALLPLAALAQPATITAESPQTYTQRYVTTDVNLRAGPGTDTRVLGVLRQGDFVNVGACVEGWCAVNAGAMPDGYVSARYIGEGANPYNDLGPMTPETGQETRSYGEDMIQGDQQSYGEDMILPDGGQQGYGDDMIQPRPDQRSYGNDMIGSAESRAFERVQARLGYRDARIAWSDDNCALYRAITPDNALHEEVLRTPQGNPICAD